MGEVVGAGILAHVPTIMLPEHERRALNHGEDFTIGPALTQLRHEVFVTLDYDTVVVLDLSLIHIGASPRRSSDGW